MSASIELLGSYWTLAGDTDPNGGREWSTIDFADRVETAAAAGFDGIGLWHADLHHILEERTLGEMRDVLDEHGIEHVELEFLDHWFLDEDDERRRESDELRATLLEAADRLEANHIKVGNLSRLSHPLPQITDSFGELCDEAAAHDTRIGLEFIAGDGTINDLDNALAIVEGADRDNGGLLLDVWHVAKLGIPYDELRRISANDLVSVELNDGIVDPDVDRANETTDHRLLPGEGEFDVERFITTVQDIGYDGPWGVEVLSKELRQRPIDEAYEQVYAATAPQFQQPRP